MFKFNMRKLLKSRYSTTVEQFDIGQIFISSPIQTLMQKLSKETLDINKVFEPRKQKAQLSTIKLLSSEKTLFHIEDAKVRALEKLQPPVIMNTRKTINKTLEINKEINNFDTSKYVFTDISFGIAERERFIVVREPNGTLRLANWDERDRITQIYFPKPNREFRIPKMFEKGFFEDCLEKGKHIFVLNRILAQFEPDNPNYILYMSQVFEHILKYNLIDKLRSTRYLPIFALYCSALRQHSSLTNVDDLLIYLFSGLKDLNIPNLFENSHSLPSNNKVFNNQDHITPENIIKAAQATTNLYCEVQHKMGRVSLQEFTNKVSQNASTGQTEKYFHELEDCFQDLDRYIQYRNSQESTDISNSTSIEKLARLKNIVEMLKSHFVKIDLKTDPYSEKNISP